MFDQVFWRATAGQINRWRRDLLHLESTSLDKMEPHKIPFLYNFSATVVPPPIDWPEWIRVAGNNAFELPLLHHLSCLHRILVSRRRRRKRKEMDSSVGPGRLYRSCTQSGEEGSLYRLREHRCLGSKEDDKNCH